MGKQQQILSCPLVDLHMGFEKTLSQQKDPLHHTGEAVPVCIHRAT